MSRFSGGVAPVAMTNKIAAVMLVALFGCGRVAGDGSAQQTGGGQLGAGSDPAGKGDFTADPGVPLEEDPYGGKVDPGSEPTLPCAELEEKMTYCKENGLDCPVVVEDLAFCGGKTDEPAKPDPCFLFLDLYKSCIVAHASDPFCDEVLLTWAKCEAP